MPKALKAKDTVVKGYVETNQLLKGLGSDLSFIIREMAEEEDRTITMQVRHLVRIALVQLGKIKQ